MSHGIFLTGATGLVGGLLLQRISKETPERPIYVLVRDRKPASISPNTTLIAGDITQPGLGIPRDRYAELCTSIDTIVHCAASTKFTLPLPASRRVNVDGTANILQLARDARQLKKFLHISSTFVAGRRRGELPEALLQHTAGWFTPYEQSKFEAEQLIREEGRSLPWVIARLSTVAGNSQTGHVSQFNYFHQLLRLVPRNRFPVIPGTPAAPVDLVADDWVASALLAIINSEQPAQSVVHLCAGPAQTLPAQEILELAFDLHRRRRPGSSATVPTFVSLAEFQDFAAGLRRRGEEILCRLAELLLLCLPHLEVPQQFLNARTTALLAQSGITPVRTRDFLPLVMQSCW